MECSEKTLRNARQVALVGLIAAGVILRLAQYLHNREFWADEAYLAVDVINMSYRELAGFLHYNMTFPLGFLFAIKFVTNLCGHSEYAFRLLSLLTGMLSVFLFATLAAHLLLPREKCKSDPPGTWLTVLIAVAFFAFGKHLIYYSSELRHYSLDIAAACALYLVVLPTLGTDARNRSHVCRTMVLGAAGAVVVWFSLTSVFILASITTVQLLLGVGRRERSRVVSAVASSAMWGASFCVHLYLLHQIMALGDRTASIHAHVASMSVPIPPKSLIDLQLWFEYLLHAFYFPGGMTYPALAAFMFFIGCRVLWKRNRIHFLLLSLPLVYMLFATALHLYPSRNQYLVFLMPWIAISLASGISLFLGSRGRPMRLAGVVLLLLLVARPAVQGGRVILEYRSGPGDDSVIKPLLAYAKANWRLGDRLLVDSDEAPMAAYYALRFGFRKEGMSPSNDNPAVYVLVTEPVKDGVGTGRNWWLSSSNSGDLPDNLGKPVHQVSSPSATLRLLDRK